MFRRTTRAMFALVAALALVAGCDSSKSNASGEESGAAQKSAEQESSEKGSQKGDEGTSSDEQKKKQAQQDDQKKKAELVDVPKDGKKFDPSVKASQIPKGAWHCNMKGKVHYAAQKKGNGECPVCGMDLKEK